MRNATNLGHENLASQASALVSLRGITKRLSAGAARMLRAPSSSASHPTAETSQHLEGRMRERLAPSTVYIESFVDIPGDIPGENGEIGIARVSEKHGTGFCVKVEVNTETGDRFAYFVTNRHVVPPVSTPGGPTLRGPHITTLIRLPSGEMRPVVDSYIDTSSYFRDLAIIKVRLEPGDTAPVPVVMNTKRVETGQTVIAVGYPGYQTNLVATSGRVSRPEPTNPIQGAENTYEGSMTLGFTADVSVGPGDSGGPVVDIDGRVVGITGHNDDKGDVPVFIPSHEAAAMASHPEIFIHLGHAFRTAMNSRTSEETHGEHAGEDYRPLSVRFSELIASIKHILEPVKAIPGAVRSVLDDESIRDRFANLLLRARNRVGYNAEYKAAFGSYGVKPLFEGV